MNEINTNTDVETAAGAAVEKTVEATSTILGKMSDFIGEHKTASIAVGAVTGLAAIGGLGFYAYNKRKAIKARKDTQAQMNQNGQDMIRLINLQSKLEQPSTTSKVSPEVRAADLKQVQGFIEKLSSGAINAGLSAGDYDIIAAIERQL